jgi:hypothetical protein
MDVELQSRTPKHGLGRDYPETAAGHGRITSTSQSRQKWGDYHTSEIIFTLYLGVWNLGGSPFLYGGLSLPLMVGQCGTK